MQIHTIIKTEHLDITSIETFQRKEDADTAFDTAMAAIPGASEWDEEDREDVVPHPLRAADNCHQSVVMYETELK